MLSWPTDVTGQGAAVALRLCGTLHRLARAGDPIAQVYPPRNVDDATLMSAVMDAVRRRPTDLLSGLDHPPQTNEVGRAAALLPGFLTIAALYPQPMRLFEIGASAGLNTLWDRFHYRLGPSSWGRLESPVRLAPDWTGPAPPAADIVVSARRACDLDPIDISRTSAAERLLSFIWPDQTERLHRAEAAIAMARTSAVTVEPADAANWLADALATPDPVHTRVVYHTIMWQYLRPDVQATIAATIAAAGKDGPVAWLRLEADGGQPGASLRLTTYPDGSAQEIARADFHGRWVHWSGWTKAPR